MNAWKSALKLIREINLTAIGKAALSGFGWVGRFLGGIAIAIAESILDKQLKKAEDNLEINQKDKEIEDKANQNVEQINGATTDAELDSAFDDSLR